MFTRPFITALLFIASIQSYCQIRYEVVPDTVDHICSIFVINDKNKTFSINHLIYCDRVKFFANDKLLVYWDEHGYCHFTDLSDGLNDLNESTYMGDAVKDVVSVAITEKKYEFTKNGVPTTDSHYIVKYLNKSGTICEMMIDKHWFMKLSDTCK
jgi:hypothetical protein